jgi:WD40 repeat protein
VSSIAGDGDRDVIVSGSDDQTVRVWDAVTGDPVGGPLAGHDGPVTSVAIGRAGNMDIIASGSDDRTVLTRQPRPTQTGTIQRDSLASGFARVSQA